MAATGRGWDKSEHRWSDLKTLKHCYDKRTNHDKFGILHASFTRKIEICSIIMAELWGILNGLQIAWNLGLKKVILETNSKGAFLAIQEMESEHYGSTVTNFIKSFLKRDWIVHLRHVLREGNKIIDGLTKTTFSRPLGRIDNMQPPNGILQALHDDLSNVA